MITRSGTIHLLAVIAALVVPMIGCGPSGHHLDEDEWDQVFGMPAENTKAASELVQRDAESRQQWLSLHEDLQAERTEIGHQRDLLEGDRRTWAERERDDPIIAAAIGAFGLIFACSLPLVLIALLIWPRKAEDSSGATCEILVGDLVSESGRLNHGGGDSKRIE